MASDWSYTQPTAQQSNSTAFVEPEPVAEAAEDGYMEDEGFFICLSHRHTSFVIFHKLVVFL